MSLTRDQWVEMWNDIKGIERTVKFCQEMPRGQRAIILSKIEKIKNQIQSVIGQME